MDLTEAKKIVKEYESNLNEIERLRAEADQIENNICNQEASYGEARDYVAAARFELDEFIRNRNDGIMVCSEKTFEALQSARRGL